MIRKPIRGIPIREKKIKGHIYLYQVIRAFRDPATGKVMKEERYLGARKPARPSPIMSKLNVEDIAVITEAWQGGEDVDLIIERVRACIDDSPSPATVYNWFRAKGIPRGERVTRRTTKRIADVEAQIGHVKQLKIEEKERMAAQAQRRGVARKEIERMRL